jgi:hypothetical protein
MVQSQPPQQQQQPPTPLSAFNAYPPAPTGYPQTSPQPQMMPQQQQMQSQMRPQVAPQQMQQQSMVPSSNQSHTSGYLMPQPVAQQQHFSSNQSQASGYGMSPQQQSYMQQQQYAATQQQMATRQMPPQQAPPAPVVRTAPAAVVQEDDDFFGAFSNAVKETSPNRPPSVFEANQHDDVSYLSKSTGGGTERGGIAGTRSPLDDPKFAPKPPPVPGLANALSLSQHAPPGASPLPDFDLVTHSGYILARISFRTILIKKWKQIYWVTYGASKVLFFRSSADFEDWVSNPYLSGAQREFLVKLKIDFVEDVYKQNVRGYQVTNTRLKNYNNNMLHQFKLERWMDYGPTIAAAYASPNEREVYNLRTVFSEMMKRAPQDKAVTSIGQPRDNPYAGENVRTVDSSNLRYGSPESNMQFANNGANSQRQMYHSSSASHGRLDYGRAGGGSVRSQQSQGVFSTGPIERQSADPVRQYVSGYRGQSAGSNGRY